jgi:hypothetical protein
MTLYIIGYLMLGFLVASIVYKIWPHGEIDDDDIHPVFGFIVMTAVWPLVLVILIIRLICQGIYKWLKMLGAIK